MTIQELAKPIRGVVSITGPLRLEDVIPTNHPLYLAMKEKEKCKFSEKSKQS